MQLTFFDSNVMMGQPTVRSIWTPVADADSLGNAMSRSGVTKALVWHIGQADGSPIDGNLLVDGMVAGHPELVVAWAILPPKIDPLIGNDFFTDMRRNRVGALRAFPDNHRYFLRRKVFGNFLDEVSSRRIPLFLSLEHGVTWPAIYALLDDYPALTCVLCDIGAWSMDRYTYPLLREHPNVFIETSFLSLEDGGVESVVREFGAARLLFGTGFPKRYMEAAQLQLIHAAISDEDKSAIAGDNLEQLLREADVSHPAAK